MKEAAADGGILTVIGDEDCHSGTKWGREREPVFCDSPRRTRYVSGFPNPPGSKDTLTVRHFGYDPGISRRISRIIDRHFETQ
jgi:hypothetical protein